ncbi:cation transporting ATPase C-terminal domain-containing protein, partial [Candidatus Woesearchaeota archaeon]|nr:cation transporting ATPase C-terminal domain-containing protein [Candidatus Woesearchaeota archaeon]
LVFFELGQALSCKSLTSTVFRIVLSNKLLLLAIISSAALQVLILAVPGLQGMFGTAALTAAQWAAVLAVASSGFIMLEVYKAVRVRRVAATD